MLYWRYMSVVPESQVTVTGQSRFGYDERAYTLPQLLDAIARQLLNRNVPAGAVVARDFALFQTMQPKVQATLLAQKLRSERHLLILDNLESVTGDALAIPNTLLPAEQLALRAFLADLLDGQTLVLLGSRGSAAWLRSRWLRQAQPPLHAAPVPEPVEGPAPLREVDVYALPGLDAEAAANLAERILQRHVPDPKQREIYAANPALPRLLKLLDGSPLALEVVLSNLARQTPEAILAALEAGDLNIDSQAQNPVLSKKERRTQTILGFIEYAYSNLDANAQRLLLVLFPFTGVVWEGMLEKYINHLQAQPALENLLLNSLHVVLQSVKSWGLLTQHEKLSGFLRIQPVLPYFLKIRLAQEPEEVKQALIIAFRLYYSEIGKVLSKFFDSERPHEQLIGQLLTQLEYENICNALRYALDAQESVSSFNDPISKYLESMHEHKQYIVLGEQILARLETYPSEKLAGQIGVEMACLIDDIARRQILMNQYTASAATYQRALSIFEQNETLSERSKSLGIASIYHQLGYVMQKQRQWISSRSFYQKALAIYIKLNHRDKLAGTYYQLGRVDYEEREWVQAEKHYQRALALSIEFNDRHDQSLIP